MKDINILFWSSILLFFVSCQNSEKKQIAKLVEEWNNREIHFPEHPVFTIQGKDTADFIFADAEYKVVSYVDSTGCTTCKLQLPRWKQLMNEVDSVTGGKVPFVFFFHPKNVKELYYILRRDVFLHPVCFDLNDKLNRLNHFPVDMNFQTFLLDRQNRVRVLGNPINNPKVKELYLRVLTGDSVASSPAKHTTVSVDMQNWNFGQLSLNQQRTHTFLLKNTGHVPLVIQDVLTTCGCTQVEYDREPIRPGKTLQLVVTYKADKPGNFHKTITVYGNMQTLRLSIDGFVNSKETGL